MFLDTTYFGHTFGALVLMDSVSKQVLSVDIVAYETSWSPEKCAVKLNNAKMNIKES